MARVNTLRHYITYHCHETTVFAEDQPQLRILWILLTKKALATQNPVSQSLRRAVLDGNALFRPTVKKKIKNVKDYIVLAFCVVSFLRSFNQSKIHGMLITS